MLQFIAKVSETCMYILYIYVIILLIACVFYEILHNKMEQFMVF